MVMMRDGDVSVGASVMSPRLMGKGEGKSEGRALRVEIRVMCDI